jgi:beta-glucanase (GH16 family)
MVLALGLLLLASCEPLAHADTGSDLPDAPLGQSGEWNLVFHDEFDGPRLDAASWVTCYWWDDQGCTIASNNELQWYQPDDVTVENGRLILSARERSVQAPDGREFAYTSGMVSTGSAAYRGPARHAFEYVHVEVRASVPAGRGLWPALWMLPASQESTPEIDIMEILGRDLTQLHMNYHYKDAEGHQHRVGSTWTATEPLTDWHVFAVDWQPHALTWYLDGEKLFHYHDDDDAGTIPAEPMYLIANLAVGGDWGGPPDAATRFPAGFEIDYIRVWTRK